MAARLLWIVCIVRQRIDLRCFQMAASLKNLYDPFPNRFTLEYLFDRHTFDVPCFDTVQPSDRALQFLNILKVHSMRSKPCCSRQCILHATMNLGPCH
jgi:hypothetical protein